MKHRRCCRSTAIFLSCLTLAVVLGGCRDAVDPADPADPGESTEATDPDDPTDPGDSTDPAEPTDPDEPADLADDLASPQVPSLHPAIDHLPEAVVTLAARDDREIRVDVKVAATPDDRRRGLMEVSELPEGVGMLFLFDEARTGGFWMWNTLVPLDIAFLDADGAILEVQAMDPCEADDPDDCPVYTPDAPFVAALEVPQGWFAWQGVGEGDQLSWTEPSPAR